ncbi:DUF5708 family protein [Bailinhaonella thermotolerans]|uniref:Uncharacterized protein n=1 Tax=Bailinhaonella thermotolerans TaxID=1070861 RepID=A0A3A4A366_9ACTN|nr:DUF5708 family protein [Bailinhaonella thermotolerans]RJL22004.1 hypothetical protein D5H75_35965 [Bailinhaonella thermotolerans]
MAPHVKTLLAGLATLAAGTALWLFAPETQILGIAPAKVGVVLMVVGGLETLYGLYKAARRDRSDADR